MASPAAEIEIDERLVTALLAEQLPALAGLPVVIAGNGWDNTIARVADEWMVRLPRRAASAPLIESEQRWLPLLAPSLPLDVPVPWFAGRPSDLFPWAWSVCRWLPGQSAAATPLTDLAETAQVLASFIDDRSWRRAAGCALNLSLAYLTSDDTTSMPAIGRATLEAVLEEFG